MISKMMADKRAFNTVEVPRQRGAGVRFELFEGLKIISASELPEGTERPRSAR